jgi:hypothetical protein
MNLQANDAKDDGSAENVGNAKGEAQYYAENAHPARGQVSSRLFHTTVASHS